MTLKALSAQSRRLEQLHGKRCIQAGIGRASALLLDFEFLHEPDESGYRQPELSLVAECPWRIETSNEVIVGYFDADEALDPGVQVSVDRTITATEVVLPSYTVHITLSDDIYVWLFPCDSREYASVSEYPSSPWYVGGYSIPGSWED